MNSFISGYNNYLILIKFQVYMTRVLQGASIVKYLIVDQGFYAKLREVHTYIFDIVVSVLKKSSPILCSEYFFISLVQFYRKEKMVGLVEKVVGNCFMIEN